MKTKYVLLFLSVLLINQNYGQTFEEYKKLKESEFSAFKLKQRKFIKQMQNEFDEYVKQQNMEYASYLEEEWKAIELFKGEPVPYLPKPPEKPKYMTDEAAKKSAIIKHIRQPSEFITEEKNTEPLLPMIKKTTTPETKGRIVNTSFYGNPVSFTVADELIIPIPENINSVGISEYWLKFSSSNFGPLINQLQNYKDILNLNDWAYYLLIKTVANELYPYSENGTELMLWSLLTQSGYKARVGYTKDIITVLIPTHNTVYSKFFFKSNGLSYYVMKDLYADNIQTYDKDFPEAKSVLDFNIDRPLNFIEDVKEKKFNFAYQGENYAFRLAYNKNVIDFYRDYPQVDIDVYFNAAVSNASQQSIREGLSGVVAEKSAEKALSILLKFVQTAFNYEIDNNQFGKEKFFFAEETIFYPGSDCEDRSVLFAYLAQELLELKVIGLSYPGHIATAVQLPKEKEVEQIAAVPSPKKTVGDRIVYEEEEYIIADATFENAPIGKSMPKYKSKTPELIILKNSKYYENLKNSYWELANQSGGFRGDQLNDLLTDTKGNTYLTGYFIEQAEFGDYTLSADSEQAGRSAFVVKYNENKQVEWAKQITSNQNATAYTLIMDNNENLFVAGSFDGTLYAGNQSKKFRCKENSSDIFLAKLSEHGQFLWIKKSGLDTYPQDNYFSYNVKFSNDGIAKGTTLYSENEYAMHSGLSIDQESLINISGSFMSSTGFGLDMLSMKADAGSEFEVFESLKFENDKLIENEYEQTIAGVFSVLNHVKLNGFKMLGADVQKTLDEYNPEFQKKYPDIYDGISKINFVMNADGILTLETSNGKTVVLRELKLKNNAKMKVTFYEDGNAMVNVISGMLVGKFFIWFDLNYAKMFKSDGNILFDYDSNHAQKLMNLKEDILD